VIDYAGMYPPASLSLAEAARLNREYRQTPQAWMLGRFVCPVEKLDQLWPLQDPTSDGSIAVIAIPTQSASNFQRAVTETADWMFVFYMAGQIDSVEFRLPTELHRTSHSLLDSTHFIGDKLQGVNDRLSDLFKPSAIYLELTKIDDAEG